MTEKEFFVQTLADETPRFERVLKAVPADKLDWKPDAKSKSALELALHIADEAHGFGFLTTGLMDLSATPASPWKTPQEAAPAMTAALTQVGPLVSGMTDADWASEAKMTMGEKELWKTTRGGMAWGLLLDLIHHRGQLSVYLRPMGGKVPSIYGPSADSPAE